MPYNSHQNTRKHHTCTHQTKHETHTHYSSHYIPEVSRRMIISFIQAATLPVNTPEASLAKEQRHTLVQMKTNKSLFPLSNLHKVYVSYNPPSFCLLCYTHVHATSRQGVEYNNSKNTEVTTDE